MINAAFIIGQTNLYAKRDLLRNPSPNGPAKVLATLRELVGLPQSLARVLFLAR